MFAVSVREEDQRWHWRRNFSRDELKLARGAGVFEAHEAVMEIAPEYGNVTFSVTAADFAADAQAEIDLHILPDRSTMPSLMCGTAAIMAITGQRYDELYSRWGISIAGPSGLTVRESSDILGAYGYELHQIQFFGGLWQATETVGRFLDDRKADNYNTYLLQMKGHVILSSRAGVLDNHSRTFHHAKACKWRRHKLLNAWAVSKKIPATTD